MSAQRHVVLGAFFVIVAVTLGYYTLFLTDFRWLSESAQKTVYFSETNGLRKGGAACYAVDGENRYHAIFDNAPCPIVHPSNTAIALQAYGASVTVAGPGAGAEPVRTRDIGMADFFVRPLRNIRKEAISSLSPVSYEEIGSSELKW